MAAFEESLAATCHRRTADCRPTRDGARRPGVWCTRWSPPPASAHDAEIDSGPTAAIVVKADGSVAWIAEVPNGEVTEYQLLAVGRAGRRVLAIATDIQPSSLTLAGNRLHWIEGGEPRSATLN